MFFCTFFSRGGEDSSNRGFFSLSLHAKGRFFESGVLSHLSFRKERCPKKALKLFLLLGRKSFRIKKKKLHASPVRVQRTAGSAVWICKSKRERNPKRARSASALPVQKGLAPHGTPVSAGR